MSGWWHETVTNGDLVLYFIGGIVFYVAKELITGFIQGWKRRGGSFREQVRQRVQQKRDERG